MSLTNNLAIVFSLIGLGKVARFFLTGIKPVGGGDDAVGPPINRFVSIASRLGGEAVICGQTSMIPCLLLLRFPISFAHPYNGDECC